VTTFNERMALSAEKHKSRVVLALDFSDTYDLRLERAEAVLGATLGEIAAVKLNHHLLLPYGLEGTKKLVDSCRREGVQTIADLKVNDIESTNLNIVQSLLDYGVDAVIANPFVGKKEGLGRVIDGVHSREGGILFLVYMSHMGAEEGYSIRVEGGEPMYRLFAKRAKEWGADGVVVSAKDVKKVSETRAIVGSDCLIFSPGIGVQGGDAESALRAGADFVIIGRSITASPNPAEVVREFNGRWVAALDL
jgi:orotidine-5'-phosphate decarboxylase